jgi:CHAT domain-containing protein/tetratricopeptide (TPR) repeat protein
MEMPRKDVPMSRHCQSAILFIAVSWCAVLWLPWSHAAAQQQQSPTEQLAAALATTKSEQEQAALLATQKALVTPELVRALIQQGNRFYEQGNYPPSLAMLGLAWQIAEQLGDRKGMARAQNSFGNVYTAQGDFRRALESLQASLTISEALGDQVESAGTLRNFGNVYYLQGNWTQAAEAFQRGLTISEALNDKPGVARGLGSLGVVYDAQSDYPQAMAYYEKALRQFEALNDKGGVARTLGNLAIVLNEQENYARALEYNLRSLALFEEMGNQGGQARTLHNIGTTYYAQGSYDKALGYYQQSLTLREKLGEKPGIARTLDGMGSAALELGNFAQALEFYRRSLALYEELGDKKGLSDVHGNLGALASEQGNHAQSLTYLQQSLALRETLGDIEGVAVTLVNLGVVQGRQGQTAKALESLARATTLARQIGDHETLRLARYHVGVLQRTLKNTAQAEQAFEESIALVEGLRENIAGGEEEHRAFMENKLAAYRALLDLRFAQGKTTEALTTAERMKARALLDVLRQGRLPIQKALTKSEREQERLLKLELTALNTALRDLKQGKQSEQTRLNELQAQLEKARFAYESFQNALYAAHPELKIQRGEAPLISTSELVALLPDAQSALLEYVVTANTTYLFTITRATNPNEVQIQSYTLPLPSAELQRRVETFRQQLAGRDLGFRAAARQLYDVLLKPAQAQLKGKTNLIIVPDDKLWDLPFQALLSGANRFVLEDAAVAYAPSLTVLREMSKRHSAPAANATTLLALGNPTLGKVALERTLLTLRSEKLAPLPEAEQEVKALGQLYGVAGSKIYIGDAAREDRVKAEAGQARILHFATHGSLNNRTPMYSHLVLAQTNTNEVKEEARAEAKLEANLEDGLLEAWELMQLDLKADLAVLSACETARGKFGAGEGMIGLTWALFVAGVPATVVSQWKVESAATRELMVAFHRQWRATSATTTKAAALRQAALSLLKKPATSHPFYWAGFVLVGNGQ